MRGSYAFRYIPPVHISVMDASYIWSNFQKFQHLSQKVLLENLEKIDDMSDGYNCHAWSVGLKYYVQPSGKTEQDFDVFYSQYGFQRTENVDLADIAVYGNSLTELDHAAVRLMVYGRKMWTSKLGGGCILIHNQLSSLEGEGAYGKVLLYYKYVRAGLISPIYNASNAQDLWAAATARRSQPYFQ